MLPLLSLPRRLLGIARRRHPSRGRAPAPRRAVLALESLERREALSITFTPTMLPNPQVGVNYSQTFTGSGGVAPYHYIVSSGALPAGLKLSDAGTISGKATADGTFNFTIKATDSAPVPASGSQAYTFNIATPTITLSPATLATAPTGVAFSRTISATGGTAPYHFSITSGSLPTGVTLNANTGVVSGTTTAVGTFHFTVSVTDSTGGTKGTGSQAITLTTQKPVASRLAFLSQPGAAAVNANLPPFQVQVLDQFGSPIGATVRLTLITVASVAAPGFKAGSVTQVAETNGVATFTKVAITARGRYILLASVGPLRAFSHSFDIALLGRHSPGQ
jgi:hypothetical protein